MTHECLVLQREVFRRWGAPGEVAMLEWVLDPRGCALDGTAAHALVDIEKGLPMLDPHGKVKAHRRG